MIRGRSCLAGLLTIALLATPALALAQDRADEPPRRQQQAQPQIQDVRFVFVEGSLPYVPDANTIAAKLPLALRLTPFNVGIVTQPLFEEQFAQVLGDALRNVSNMNVQSGFGVFDFFIVRGFDSISSGLILTDGASEPESTFYKLYNVEAVEVLKGPGGFLYGSNPLAGTVNLVRKQPLPLTSTSVGASFGRFDDYQGTLDFNLADRDGEVSFRLNSLFQDAGHYRDGKESQIVAVNPALTWTPSERGSLNVNFEYAREDFVPDSGLPLFANELPDVPRSADYQSPFDTSEQNIVRAQADWQHRVSDVLTVRNKLYYRDLDWLSAGTLFNGVFPIPVFGPGGFPIAFKPELVRTLIALDDRQRFAGNQLEAIVEFDTGGVEHSLLAGFELARYADEFTLDVGLLPNIDLFDPVETAAEPIFFLPDQSQVGDSRSLVAAPYLIDQIRFSDHFQLLVGGRVDSIDFDDSLNGVSRDDTKASPMIGAVVAPNETVSLFANFSRSFAPPAPRVQDGNLAPEEGDQIEGGVKLRLLGGRAQTTVSVYRVERDNIAIPDDNGFTQQVGDQRSQGLEFDLVMDVRRGLRAAFAYAYNDAELTRFSELVTVFDGFVPRQVTIDRSGNVPAFAPEHLLNFWVSKTFDNGVGIGGGGRWVSEQFIAEDNGFVIDDSLTLDAAVHWDWQAWHLQFNVKNLTDEDLLTRGFGSQGVVPAEPLTAFGSIGYRF